jgi:hypothetical protein
MRVHLHLSVENAPGVEDFHPPHQSAQVVPAVSVKQIGVPLQLQQVAAEPQTTLPHCCPVPPPLPPIPPLPPLPPIPPVPPLPPLPHEPQPYVARSPTHTSSHVVAQQ